MLLGGAVSCPGRWLCGCSVSDRPSPRSGLACAATANHRRRCLGDSCGHECFIRDSGRSEKAGRLPCRESWRVTGVGAFTQGDGMWTKEGMSVT